MDDITVTSGDMRYAIYHPSVRALVGVEKATYQGGKEASLSFVYEGPTEILAELGGGQIRHQVAIKLCAQTSDVGNSCIYAVWRWAPDAPQFWTTAKVGNDYFAPPVTYLRHSSYDRPVVGEGYVMEARLDGPVLQVWLDGEIMRVDVVHPAVMAMLQDTAKTSTYGLRTDNAIIRDIEMVGQVSPLVVDES